MPVVARRERERAVGGQIERRDPIGMLEHELPHFLAGGQVPLAAGAIAAGSDEPLAVGRETQRVIEPLWPTSSLSKVQLRRRPSAACHSRMWPRSSPLASRSPSGENASAETSAAWPLSVRHQLAGVVHSRS